MTNIRGVKLALVVALVTACVGVVFSVWALSSVGDPNQADVIAGCLRTPAGLVSDARTQLDVERTLVEISTNANHPDPDQQQRARDAVDALRLANGQYQTELSQAHDDPASYAAACRKGP